MDASHAPDCNSAPLYASVTARLMAYTIDCTLLFGGLLVWQAALYLVNPLVAIMRRGHQPTGGQLHRWVFATATLPFLLYFAVTQSSTHQATVGMQILNLEVATLRGMPVSFKQALVRCMIMLVPFELNHAVLFHLMPRNGKITPAFVLGYSGVWAIIAAYVTAIPCTKRHQSVHDLVAGTIVQRVRQEHA